MMNYDSLKKIWGLLFFTFFILCKGFSWADPSGVLIDFSSYPTKEAIQPLIDAKNEYPYVPMRVVFNPSNGVGQNQDMEYVEAITILQKAGIEVAGYVFTDYYTRPVTDIIDEIDLWSSWYQPDGIFLDEINTMSSDYLPLTDYIKSLGMKFSIGKPSTAGNSNNYTHSVDTLIADSTALKRKDNKAVKSNFAISVSDTNKSFETIAQAKSMNQWVYIKHPGATNHEMEFPAYFTQVVAALSPVGTMIPFYIYPTQSAIQPLIAAKTKYPTVPIRVILNPHSGPGSSRDSTYVNAIAQLKAAGISVLGYVHSNYGKRSAQTVNNEINQWVKWYNPDGIFVDQMGKDNCYYTSITSYAKSLGIKYVVGNPGTNISPSVGNSVDTINIYSNNTIPNLDQFQSWYKAYPPSKISLLVYGISSLPTSFISQASKYFSWIYITNDTSNPWDNLPNYFTQLVAALSTSGTPTPMPPNDPNPPTDPNPPVDPNPPATGTVGTIVPFYIYPTQAAIQPLITAKNQHPNVPIRVILNPNSGPGSSKNTTYANAIAQLKAAGISVSGYVHTSYGSRSLSTVNSEISQWMSWYNPDGIFLDEMGLNHSYYQSITSYAKNLGAQYVIGNPGSNIDVSAGDDVDVVLVFENSSLPNLSNFQSWYNKYPATKIGLLSYNISSLPTSFVNQASQNFGWIYITHDGGTNPWDSLSNYFLNFVQLLDTL